MKTIGKLALGLIGSLILVCSINAQTNIGGGGGSGSSSGIASSGVTVSPQCGTQANCITINADAHASAIPSFTNTSNIVTCTDCNFQGTDQLGRAIAKVGQIAFGTNATTDVSQLNSATITPECVIQSIDSNTQIHLGTIAVPANPCNATANTTTSGYLIWGDLDSASSTAGTQTTSNDALFKAWTLASNNCVALNLGFSGMALVERGEFNTSPAGQCGAAPYVNLLRQGFTVFGQGPAATILVITPNLLASDCSVGCFFSAPNMNIQELQLVGFGNSTPGSSYNNKNLVALTGLTTAFGTNFFIRHVIFQGWGSQQTGTVGVNIGQSTASSISGGSLSDNIFEAIGANVMTDITAGGFIMAVDNQIVGCGIASGTFGGGCLHISNGIWNSHDNFYGYAPSSGFTNANTVVCATSSVVCDFSGDVFPYQGTSGTSQILQNGSQVNINEVYISSSINGVVMENGGSVRSVQSTISSQTAGNSLVCASGTCNFYDGGDNTISGFTNGATMNYFGDASITGTPITAAKLVLSANWGGAAAWSNLKGNTRVITGTITASGTTGASPTIAYTFPTPFIVAPNNCKVILLSTTQASPPAFPFTCGTPSATAVTITYNGTPTTAATFNVEIDVGNQ